MSFGAGREMAEILHEAEVRLWSDFKDAGRYVNTGDIGTGRENAVASFLRGRLPSRFGVASGEVIDVSGSLSGQTDILIFDRSNTAPLLSDGNVILPVEALLAAIEVKSNLTRDEVKRSLKGFQKLRHLRPWGDDWGIRRRDGSHADDGHPRFFSSIFAYNTDLVESNWPRAELARVRDECDQLKLHPGHVDYVAVLSRGIALPAAGSVMKMDQDRRVLGQWHFALLNFLARETARRKPFPCSDYAPTVGQDWETVLAPRNDVPPPQKYSTMQRKKYKQGRTRPRHHK